MADDGDKRGGSSELDEIRMMQVQLSSAILALSKEKNADKLMERAKAIQIMGAEMAVKAQVFETVEKSKWPEPQSGSVIVKLTADQQQRINMQTGVQMDELVIENAGVTYSEMMPYMEPPVIEAMAMRKAERIKAEREGKIAADAQLNATVAALDAIDSEEHQKRLAELKKDPDFLGGAYADANK